MEYSGMNRRSLLRRLGGGTVAASTVAGLASADDGPMVFEELEIDGETVYVHEDLPESRRAELTAESACDCPLCPKCFNCTCDGTELTEQSFDREVVVR